METTAFDTKISLNLKGGLDLLVKDPVKMSMQEVQPGRNSLSSASDTEKSTFEEVLIGLQPVVPFSPREDAPLPVAGPVGKKLLSLNEKKEQTGDAETAIHRAKAMLKQAINIPVTGDSAPHADPSPTEKTKHLIAPPYEPDAALFAQAVKHQNAAHLERKTGESPTGKPILEEAPAPAAPTFREVRPLSDRHADHRFSLEGTERRKEPAFMQRADETLKLKNNGPATDGALDVRQASPSHHDHRKRAGESKEGASITAALQKPISAAGNGDATIAQGAPERMTPGGSPDKTLPIGDAVMETMDLARDHQQSRNTTPNHQMRLPERDMFPFRMEMPNIASQQETRPLATVGSTGIQMQAVIDQILEARQGVGKDSGRIRILLNPPNLGTIDLDIIVRGERVEVLMTAENATVQQALQSRADDIRIALQRQDLKIETFHVLLQNNTANQQQANSGAAFEQHRGQWARQTSPEECTPIQPLIRSAGESGTAQGLVSIFV